MMIMAQRDENERAGELAAANYQPKLEKKSIRIQNNKMWGEDVTNANRKSSKENPMAETLGCASFDIVANKNLNQPANPILNCIQGGCKAQMSAAQNLYNQGKPMNAIEVATNRLSRNPAVDKGVDPILNVTSLQIPRRACACVG